MSLYFRGHKASVQNVATKAKTPEVEGPAPRPAKRKRIKNRSPQVRPAGASRAPASLWTFLFRGACFTWQHLHSTKIWIAQIHLVFSLIDQPSIFKHLQGCLNLFLVKL